MLQNDFLIIQNYFLISENNRYFLILENYFLILENEFLILKNNRYFLLSYCHTTVQHSKPEVNHYPPPFAFGSGTIKSRQRISDHITCLELKLWYTIRKIFLILEVQFLILENSKNF